MEDWEEDYFTEEAWSNAKKAAFIIGCSIMAWVGIGLLIQGGYYLYQMI